MNGLTQSLFGTNIQTFLTEGWNGKGRTEASNSSWEITLGELLTMPNQGRYQGYQMSTAIKRNLGQHGVQSLVTIFGAKVVAGMLKNLGINRTLNKAVRSVGMGKAVKF